MSSSRRHRSRAHLHATAPGRGRREAAALLVFAVALIATLTLWPMEDTGIPPFCVVCPGAQTADFVVNVALFVPFGVALAGLGLGWRSAMAIGAAFSVAIEVTQLLFVDGRVASPLDVLANALGAAAGVPLAASRRWLLYPRSRRSLAFATAAAAAWLVVLILGAIGLRRAGGDGAMFAQWSPDLPMSPRFTGRVVSAAVGNLPIPDGPVSDTAALRREMGSTLHVAVATTRGEATPAEAPVVRLVDEGDRELFVLSRVRTDLVFRTRVVASAIGLHSPTVLVRDAFAGGDSDAATLLPITGVRERDVIRASAGGASASLPIHPALGWALLAPFDTGASSRALPVSALWVGAPLIVVGYWIGRRARRRARRSGRERGWSSTAGELIIATPAIACLLAVGLGGIAAIVGQRLPPPEVWAAAVAGVGVGLALGVRLAMRHGPRGPSKHVIATADAPVERVTARA